MRIIRDDLVRANKSKKKMGSHSLFSQQQATHNTIQTNREIHVKDRYCGITILILKIEK